jgi:DNA-binding MarR family transcriptional regulator
MTSAAATGTVGPSDASTADADQLEPDEVELMMRTSRLVTAVVAQSLDHAQTHVTTPQLRTLVVLASVHQCNLSALAARLGVNPSNASRTCDQLVALGLVAREVADDDRRRVTLGLSDDGLRLVDALMTERRALFSAVVDAMSPEDRTHLRTGLDAFLTAAGDVAETEELLAPSRAAGGVSGWLT